MLKNTIGESKRIIILACVQGKQNLHKKEEDINGGPPSWWRKMQSGVQENPE